jgi:hypothetical protein
MGWDGLVPAISGGLIFVFTFTNNVSGKGIGVVSLLSVYLP